MRAYFFIYEFLLHVFPEKFKNIFRDSFYKTLTKSSDFPESCYCKHKEFLKATRTIGFLKLLTTF
jgi:hypothetical protein